MLIGEIRRYDCQVVLLWRTADMYGAPSVTRTQHQATMSSRIVRIVLDHVALDNHLPDFRPAYHPRGPQHLPQRMGQEQHLSLCSHPDPVQDVLVAIHGCMLPTKTLRGSIVHEYQAISTLVSRSPSIISLLGPILCCCSVVSKRYRDCRGGTNAGLTHHLVLQTLRKSPLETGQPFGAPIPQKAVTDSSRWTRVRLTYRFPGAAKQVGSAITWRENSHLACSVSYLTRTQSCDPLPETDVVMDRNVNAWNSVSSSYRPRASPAQ